MATISTPYTRKAPQQPDGRTRDARLMRETRQNLIDHVGGKPTHTQRVLIERSVWLTLAVTRLDAKMLASGGLSDHASREYLAWTNTLARTMRHLGLKGAPPPIETLDEILARSRKAAA